MSLALFVSLKQKISDELKSTTIADAFRQVERWAADPGNGLVQPGDIIASVGSATTRPGYYLCNGATYNVSIINKKLQKALGQTGATLTVPNLANVFLQGSVASGATGGSGIGSGSGSALVPHSHTLSSNGYTLLQLTASFLGGISQAVAGYTANVKASSFAGVATSTAVANGFALAGSTDSASPSTGSVNISVPTIPPYYTVQYWIKY